MLFLESVAANCSHFCLVIAQSAVITVAFTSHNFSNSSFSPLTSYTVLFAICLKDIECRMTNNQLQLSSDETASLEQFTMVVNIDTQFSAI